MAQKDLYGRIQSFLTRRESASYFWKLRTQAQHKNPLIRYWARLRYHKLMLRNGSGIPYMTRIDGLPSFPHGIVGVFISQGAHIGENCVIFHQVTIGSNLIVGSKGYGAPSIGSNVFIGCGAKIIGGVHIGDNVRIGANCVVTEDVPANATVVLERPRIILHEGTQELVQSREIPNAD